MILNNERLKKIQRVELGILLYFDQFCKENDIEYFLGGGTLLGAIRHSGFIPWDDDVDVMMTRDNYNNFCKVAASEKLDGRFFFQVSDTDSEYHDYMAKLRLKDTAYATRNNLQFEKMEKGFFIDIFPHDLTSNNRTIQRLHIFITKLTRSMVYHKWFNTPMQYYGKYELICKIFTWIISFLSISLLEKIRDSVTVWFSHHNNSRYLYDGCGMHLDHGAFDKTILDEKIMVEFEGYLFPVPKRFDEYLRFSYGNDYMKLPPEAERIPHHDIVLIDFGDVKLDELY